MTPADLIQQGLQFEQAGQFDHAESAYRRALETDPQQVNAHLALGRLYLTRNQPDRAIAEFRRAAELQPRFAGAYCELGFALAGANRLDESVIALEKAIALQPTSATAYFALGNTRKRQGQPGMAIAAYQKSIDLDPNAISAYVNLANVYHSLHNYAQALHLAEQAIAVRPDIAEAFNTLGMAAREMGEPARAVDAFRRALALRPDYTPSMNNLGNALLELRQIAEAIRCFERALALEPGAALIHANLGRALLLSGNYPRGLVEHEWRFAAKAVQTPPRDFAQPRWDGSDVAGRRILIWPEQGMGDVLQSVRYIPIVAQRGGHVIFECYADLVGLLSKSCGAGQIIASGQPPPPFDVHIPMMSLPLALGSTLETIPAPVPYVHADPQLTDAWRARLSEAGSNLKVGLVWAGNPGFRVDRNRRATLNDFAPLGDVSGVHLASLQKGYAAAQLGDPPANLRITDYSLDLTDWAQTAALIANLDLVICVDTAVAHLSGAMGKPTWLLLGFAADWRWLLDRADSPWYPTMRLFRQPTAGDWATPARQVTDALRELARSRAH